MPTPFQHLIYARQVLNDPALPAELRERLQTSLGAYLLGSTAVDVQSLTGRSRYSTHFYHISAVGGPPAYDTFFAEVPELANPARLTPEHAAFISGYLVHLAYDEVWNREIFLPFYRNADHWADRLSYSVHHNAVRVLLDQRAQAQLSAWPEVMGLLGSVHPRGWLPFVQDATLELWSDWLVTQMEQSTSHTSQVFAERMGVPPAQLDGLAACIQQGECVLPDGLAEALASYEANGCRQSLCDLGRYWSCAAPVLADVTVVHHCSER